MKRILIVTSILVIVFAQNISAQIDTNNVYPLHKGNLWEYTNYSNVHYYQVIVGEETMPNGITYKKRMSVNLVDDDLEWDTTYTFWRVEGEEVYIYDGKDTKMFDTSLPEGSVWIVDSVSYYNFHGIKHTIRQRYYDAMFADTLTYFFAEEVRIDTSVNPPDTSVVVGLYISFTKGVGKVGGPNGVSLTAAIIDGKKYGNVTVDVKDEKPILDNYEIEIATYPNPFNSICNVVFTIPKTQNIKLKLLNMLGEEVYTLYSGKLQKGEKQFQVHMPIEISSGIFFILLDTEQKNYSKKIIYLK